MNNSQMTKEFIFKQDMVGTSKKNGRNFRVIELHDSHTLDNVRFFVREGQQISTTGIAFKDKVLASFGMDMMYGRMETVLQAVRKA